MKRTRFYLDGMAVGGIGCFGMFGGICLSGNELALRVAVVLFVLMLLLILYIIHRLPLLQSKGSPENKKGVSE